MPGMLKAKSVREGSESEMYMGVEKVLMLKYGSGKRVCAKKCRGDLGGGSKE